MTLGRVSHRLFAVIIVLICCGASAQDNDPIEAKLLSMMNHLRSESSLPLLSLDKRLNDAATLHVAEFIKNEAIVDQYPNEPGLMERFRMAQIPSGLAGEIMVKVADLNLVPEQVRRIEANNQVLFNPKFSLAGFAAVRSNGALYVVANFARPLKELSMDEVEELVVNSIQELRISRNIVPYKIASMRNLRGLACEMAKRDSLKATPINPYGGVYIGAPSPEVRNFTYTTTDPGTLPASIQNIGHEPKIDTVSVGACFGNSKTYPDGTYWVAAVFYHK